MGSDQGEGRTKVGVKKKKGDPANFNILRREYEEGGRRWT